MARLVNVAKNNDKGVNSDEFQNLLDEVTHEMLEVITNFELSPVVKVLAAAKGKPTATVKQATEAAESRLKVRALSAVAGLRSQLADADLLTNKANRRRFTKDFLIASLSCSECFVGWMTATNAEGQKLFDVIEQAQEAGVNVTAEVLEEFGS